MKKLLPILIASIFFGNLKSQLVFCPPGAEWHYYFNWFNGGKINEHVKYVGDSLDGSDTLKILSHKRLLLGCSPLMSKTLIKQKGDTIFFKNSQTQNGWQVLYNFAATTGQSWKTTVDNGNTFVITYTFTVDSVKQVLVNGSSLKRLYVKEKAIFSSQSYTWNTTTSVTERLGCDNFLFNFRPYNFGWCDADYFAERLCYKDNSFGLLKFTDKSCDYSIPVGISEQSQNAKLRVYPNPVQDFLLVDLESAYEVASIITDISGRPLRKIKLDKNSKIDISDLSKGIYFLSIFEGTEKNFTTKFIKE
ncbi:hypothetical protein CNR22_05430 [Sphingobacteriaceae bacterium]|nr:hypothetical protein CNR22_05430 [Sphingobacteriaceae bacterium]